MSLLTVRNLSFRYDGAKQAALQNVAFDLSAGQYLLVCGDGGSGKSTLCRALTGLIPHFYDGQMTGEVLIDGLSTVEIQPGYLFGHVSAVFEKPAHQFFCGTVEEEIVYGLESLGTPSGKILERVRAAAGRLALLPLLQRKPHELSGGEQQLVLLAAMLAVDAPLLVLDEPFAHLDGDAARRLSSELRAAVKRGRAVVVFEHRLDLVLPQADAVLYMERGYIAAIDSAERLQPRAGCGRDDKFSINTAAYTGIKPPMTAGGTHNQSDLVIQLKDVSISIADRPVIHNITLEVHRGECLAITGPNGAGKTTLVSHLIGAVQADTGNSYVCGHDPGHSSISQMAQVVGFCFQNPDSQLSALTVREELEIGPRALKRLDPQWIDELCELLGLREFEQQAPFSLSGGQRRRVTIAAAAAARAPLLVLDEPTAGQDPESCRRVAQLIKRVQHDGGAVVVVTHDEDFAAACADRRLELTRPAAPAESHRNPLPGTTAKTQTSRGFDPRAGLAAAASAAAVVLTLPGGAPTFAFYGVVLTATAVLRRLREYLRWLRIIAPVAAAWVVIAGLSSGWAAGATAGGRLLSMSSVFFLFFRTTTPARISDALQSAGIPHRAAFVLRGGLQFVPVLQGVIGDVITAQKARGLRPRRAPVAFLVPLLLQSFRCADRLAEAMELRGFSRSDRTQFRPGRLGAGDWFVIGGSVSAAVIIFLMIPV
ncbi:MAG: ATP-binding cassette domain-containing protein [Spirochaeta sp.]